LIDECKTLHQYAPITSAGQAFTLSAARPSVRAPKAGAGEHATNGDQFMSSEQLAGRPVIVTTEYRGVFFGYATDTSGDTINLSNARNCIYWSAATGGFMGLASKGPAEGSRIGETVAAIALRKITAVLEMTPAAVAAWTEAKTYVG
jgi:hypothetical protein